jgi:hypothetical protein
MCQCYNFELWSKVFPGYLGIRKALRAVKQDARHSEAQVGASQRSPSLPLQCSQQDSWTGLGIRHVIGVWIFVKPFGEKASRGCSAFISNIVENMRVFKCLCVAQCTHVNLTCIIKILIAMSAYLPIWGMA